MVGTVDFTSPATTVVVALAAVVAVGLVGSAK